MPILYHEAYNDSLKAEERDRAEKEAAAVIAANKAKRESWGHSSSGHMHQVSERCRCAPLRHWLFTPESQWYSRGTLADLTGNACTGRIRTR
jgi:hypothetical protein